MENQSYSPFYSELSLNPDLPTLAERCKLLTEILLDCNRSLKRSPYAVALVHTWKK